GGGYNGRVDIIEPAIVEELVDGKGHRMADAHYRTEGIGARAKVRDLPEKFERMFLGLQGKFFGVAVAKDLQCAYLQFNRLALGRRRDEVAPYRHTRPGGNAL